MQLYIVKLKASALQDNSEVLQQMSAGPGFFGLQVTFVDRADCFTVFTSLVDVGRFKAGLKDRGVGYTQPDDLPTSITDTEPYRYFLERARPQ